MIESEIHKVANKNIFEKNADREVLFYFQLQKIHQLVNLGATDYLNVIKDEIVKLMSFQDENGRFPMQYHHHAHACNLLFDLGLQPVSNRFLKKKHEKYPKFPFKVDISKKTGLISKKKKEKINKEKVFDDVKKSEIYNKVLEILPDAELLDIKKNK